MVLKDANGKEIKLGSKVAFLRGTGRWSKKTVMTIGEVFRIRTDESLRLDGHVDRSKVMVTVRYTVTAPKQPRWEPKIGRWVEPEEGETEQRNEFRNLRNPSERSVVID